MIVAGYNKRKATPDIISTAFPGGKLEDLGYDFGVMFGGQMKEIQRIVFGTDTHNKNRLSDRQGEMLFRYRDILQKWLDSKKVKLTLPSPLKYVKELHLFSDKWNIEGLNAPWGDFSVQNAIECVSWLVDIMCKSQQLSSALPTVGGEIHIGLITKSHGFKFVSRREYQHGEFTIPREEGN